MFHDNRYHVVYNYPSFQSYINDELAFRVKNIIVRINNYAFSSKNILIYELCMVRYFHFF